jgi:hypothetical protein
MAYEMKVSEYGEALENAEVYESELRSHLQNRLVEAKEKVKALKKVDAMKHKAHKTDKELEEMRQQANEEKSSTGGEIDRSKKGVTKHTQNPDRFSDEPHTEPKSQAKSQSAADKAKDNAMDKAEEKEGKNYEKRFPGSVTRVKDGKKVAPVKEGGLPMTTVNGKKVPKFAADGSGPNDVAKDKAASVDDKNSAPKKGVNPFAKKGAAPKKGVNPFAKKTNEALKGKQKNLDVDDDNDIDAKDLAALRAKKKDRIKEAVAAKCNESTKSKSCPVHGMKDCSTAKTNSR